jgi:hypothetical protein
MRVRPALRRDRAVRCPDCVGGVGIVEVDLYAGTGVAASFSA